MARAASDDSDDEFSQALECSIHFDVIKQPKALPCLHTFCRECLEPLVKDNLIECPLCREVCQLPANGVDGLRNNIVLQTILDALCVSCQKRPKRITCLCCQWKLCKECEIQHYSKLLAKINDKKQFLRRMATVLNKKSQKLSQNTIEFLSQVAMVKAEIKTIITKAMEQLQRKEAQLDDELNSLVEAETEKMNQYQENIQELEQAIQAALEMPHAVDADKLEDLEGLSADIIAEISMTVSPATVSYELDEQLVKDVCAGLWQLEYKPPQPGSGAPTALLQYQADTIDCQEIDITKKVFGQKGSHPGQFNGPTYLAVSPVSGILVICDAGNSRVQIFTADGKFIRQFGSKGQGEGQFNCGSCVYDGGVTVTDAGEIVIADTWNHRLQVFDEDGEFIRVIRSEQSSSGPFGCPTGVACDHSDYLYICDKDNQTVHVMTMDGSVVKVITNSDVPGVRWGPVDIAVCPDGDLVVADCGTGLQVFSATWQHKATIPCGEGQHVECRWPAGVAVDPQGHILVTDVGSPRSTHRVYVVEKSGELVGSFGGYGTSPGQFIQPAGVAITQDGGIIVADHGNNRLQIF